MEQAHPPTGEVDQPEAGDAAHAVLFVEKGQDAAGNAAGRVGVDLQMAGLVADPVQVAADAGHRALSRLFQGVRVLTVAHQALEKESLEGELPAVGGVQGGTATLPLGLSQIQKAREFLADPLVSRVRHEVPAPAAPGRQPWRNACTDTEKRMLRDRASHP
ncbi:hypothetical protein [Streptomyces sp. NPDC007100]|uniref:hypothetical protein n=1 Tax=Streptomyces sp. NPDC007100 TaxID=3155602 RepID=UPI0033F41499